MLGKDKGSWLELNAAEQDAASVLGFDALAWDEGLTPLACEQPWQQLRSQPKLLAAAETLGYTESSWDAELEQSNFTISGTSAPRPSACVAPSDPSASLAGALSAERPSLRPQSALSFGKNREAQSSWLRSRREGSPVRSSYEVAELRRFRGAYGARPSLPTVRRVGNDRGRDARDLVPTGSERWPSRKGKGRRVFLFGEKEFRFARAWATIYPLDILIASDYEVPETLEGWEFTLDELILMGHQVLFGVDATSWASVLNVVKSADVVIFNFPYVMHSKEETRDVIFEFFQLVREHCPPDTEVIKG